MRPMVRMDPRLPELIPYVPTPRVEKAEGIANELLPRGKTRIRIMRSPNTAGWMIP